MAAATSATSRASIGEVRPDRKAAGSWRPGRWIQRPKLGRRDFGGRPWSEDARRATRTSSTPARPDNVAAAGGSPSFQSGSFGIRSSGRCSRTPPDHRFSCHGCGNDCRLQVRRGHAHAEIQPSATCQGAHDILGPGEVTDNDLGTGGAEPSARSSSRWTSARTGKPRWRSLATMAAPNHLGRRRHR